MNKKGVSTLVEVMGILLIVIILLFIISKSNYKSPEEQNRIEISQSEKWQTNGADN